MLPAALRIRNAGNLARPSMAVPLLSMDHTSIPAACVQVDKIRLDKFEEMNKVHTHLLFMVEAMNYVLE